MKTEAIQVLFEEHDDHNFLSCYHRGKQYGCKFDKDIPFEYAERDFRQRVINVILGDNYGADYGVGSSCIFCGRISV